jgi:hypothetical protein
MVSPGRGFPVGRFEPEALDVPCQWLVARDVFEQRLEVPGRRLSNKISDPLHRVESDGESQLAESEAFFGASLDASPGDQSFEPVQTRAQEIFE